MPAFLITALGFSQFVLKSVLGWLSKRSLAELACIALALVCAVQFLAIKGEKRHAAKVAAQLGKCGNAREADRAAYAKAQKDAQAKNAAHVADVEAQQKRINDERVQSLNDRLGRLAGELRAHGPAAQGHSGGAG